LLKQVEAIESVCVNAVLSLHKISKCEYVYEARFCKKMVGDTQKLGFLFSTLFVSNHSDFIFLTMFVHHITIKMGKTLDEYSYH